MGPGASKLKHLSVKQQDKTQTTKGTVVPNETRYWVCRWHNLRRNEKTMTGKTVQGRAIRLVLDFMLKSYQAAGDA